MGVVDLKLRVSRRQSLGDQCIVDDVVRLVRLVEPGVPVSSPIHLGVGWRTLATERDKL
jgi:hypothetical protein